MCQCQATPLLALRKPDNANAAASRRVAAPLQRYNFFADGRGSWVRVLLFALSGWVHGSPTGGMQDTERIGLDLPDQATAVAWETAGSMSLGPNLQE